MKINKKQILFAGLFTLTACVVFAAAPPPPGGGAGATCWPPPCVPIDGGISFLIAAGVAYGGKKLYDFRKK